MTDVTPETTGSPGAASAHTASRHRAIDACVGEVLYERRTRSQNVHLKNLSFLAKSKIGIFACFFAQT